MAKKSLVFCGFFITAAIISIQALLPGRLAAANIIEAFMMLPDEQCGHFDKNKRQHMIDSIKQYPGGKGRPSVPDVEEPWLRHYADHALVLERPSYGPISYKLFQATGNTQLLAICRGRQNSPSPNDPKCPFDLCLYSLDIFGLTEVAHDDFLPSISVLDFITKETLTDPVAVNDIAELGMQYNSCLTCNLSVNDAFTLDIITVTSINTAICGRLLPNFGLLPLKWNGLEFSKPYDRAAPVEGVAP